MKIPVNLPNDAMKTNDRRHFLKKMGGLMGLALASPQMRLKKKPLLAFSTLGCPKWSLQQVVQCAADNGYQGIEIRGVMGQLDLPALPAFGSTQLPETKRLFTDKNLRIVDLGSSAQLHQPAGVERQKHLDDGKRFIDLAQKLDCPFIRVFPNDLPPDQEETRTLELISSGLLDLAEHAKGSQVTVLLESHGKVVRSNLLLKIMEQTRHKQVGLVWDICNMWFAAREAPDEVYRQLKPYIRHVHVKDARFKEEKEVYVLLGEGEVPLATALGALQKGGYEGYYSFEWEKLWHPELAEPEVAFPHYPKAIQRFL